MIDGAGIDSLLAASNIELSNPWPVRMIRVTLGHGFDQMVGPALQYSDVKLWRSGAAIEFSDSYSAIASDITFTLEMANNNATTLAMAHVRGVGEHRDKRRDGYSKPCSLAH